MLYRPPLTHPPALFPLSYIHIYDFICYIASVSRSRYEVASVSSFSSGASAERTCLFLCMFYV